MIRAILALVSFALSAYAQSTSSCPKAEDSLHRLQLAFEWEGSSSTYAGNATLAEEAAVLRPIGEHRARIAEASDAGDTAAYLMDGADGDVAFQFNNLKVLATVGEVDYKTGMMIVGVPDGLGAMLADDETVRCVVQSESYGPVSANEAHPYLVNDGAAAITGSHVQYVDYDREMMSTFMTSSLPASTMVKGAGELITKAYNLKGEAVGPRSRTGPTTSGAFDSNVDADGNYVLVAPPVAGGVSQQESDWVMQSLCSAQLAEKHQWGEGKGFEDDIFLTNEEWIILDESNDQTHIGLPAHAIDIATKTSHAVGAFTLGGFEKIVEFSSGHADYVVLAVSGYNGAISNHDAILAARNSAGTRPDGSAWVWPQNICPARIYIGKKGFDADGNTATDFLSRNGLNYGQMYGFAVDSSDADFADRDAWHKTHYNGDEITGKFYPINWRWDGTVRNFDLDGSWHFQIPPKGAMDNHVFWNGAGNSSGGSKTEHVSPEPAGDSAFFQTSTSGYFGKYSLLELADSITSAASEADPFPSGIDATYRLYQGETSIEDLIDMGDASKGQTANGKDQTTMCDSSMDNSNSCGSTEAPGKTTFEDIDGFEAFSAAGGATYSIIQEDGGNLYGERMFIYQNRFDYGSSPSSKPFKFIAQSGGKKNSRMLAGVGVPAGTNDGPNSHEFSGVDDLSGMMVKQKGVFALKASDSGHKRRDLSKEVAISDKLILIGLQAHNLDAGVVRKFGADRGGQWMLYQPRMEGDGTLPTETAATFEQYECNAFTDEQCHIHPSYKQELETACGSDSSPGGSDSDSSSGGSGSDSSETSSALGRACVLTLSLPLAWAM